MAIGGVNVGQELLNVPMGDMIRSMALAIAQAQWELDKSSMTVTELMSGQRLLRDLDTGKLLDKDGKPTGRDHAAYHHRFTGVLRLHLRTFDVAGDGKIAGADTNGRTGEGNQRRYR